MLRIKQRVSCKEFFRNKEILTVSSMFIFEIIKHVKLNSCEFEWFDHGYNTRHNNVKLPHFRTKAMNNSVYRLGGVLYNKLPDRLKNIGDLNIFLRELKCLLTQGAYYTVDEFLASALQ